MIKMRDPASKEGLLYKIGREKTLEKNVLFVVFLL